MSAKPFPTNLTEADLNEAFTYAASRGADLETLRELCQILANECDRQRKVLAIAKREFSEISKEVAAIQEGRVDL